MQQIAYVVVYIILLDEYVVFTKFLYLQFTVNFSETISDARVDFLHFFQFKGTRSEDTNRTIF